MLYEARIGNARLFREMEPDASPTARKYPARKRSYTIQSVVRAVAVLNAFSSTSEVLDLRVITGRVRLNKGTTFRLLETSGGDRLA